MALPAATLVRAILIVVGGIPVCTAIVAFALGFTGYELLAAEPFAPRSDLVMPWVFASLASVVLVVSWRAWRRVWRGQDDGAGLRLVAALVPLLLLVGAVGGAWFTVGIIRSGERARLEGEESLCRSVLESDDDKQIAACLPHARRCEKESHRMNEVPAGDGWKLRLDFNDRPQVICLRRAGRPAGWIR